ncbi:MAG: peroxide stress protein YaaA [Kiritimatiellaceae bacterium]|nr:peroxide stress protein YaaA [Kiritimatiellaceae bacterium]
MLILSPSKSMDVSPAKDEKHTLPSFLDQSEQLIKTLRTFSTAELMRLMSISRPLAELNQKRFEDWTRTFSLKNAKQALFMFTGDVYDGLEGTTLHEKELQFAQQNLAILSGLYGILRPLDIIQPYRLEMGCQLKVTPSQNLYSFWKSTLTETVNEMPGDQLFNLASQEYFKVLDQKKLEKQVITPVFKDEKNGVFKIISFYAKRARGSMARFIIKNQISEASELLEFEENGYRYAPQLSTPTEPVFTRKSVPSPC